MDEEENFDTKNDDNDDIYKDIGDFHFDRELVKLEECNKAYSEDIKRLSAKIKQLTEKNTELQSVNDILTTNISILLKTAKAEIQRKQFVINDFRKKIDDTNRRNYRRHDVKNLGVCKICRSKFSKDKGKDREFGKTVKNTSEDDTRSEVESHRSFKKRERREYSGHHKKGKKRHGKSRDRSSEKYSGHSHRSSWRSDDNRSHHSRSSRRYRSPDERRHYSRRERSREKTYYSSDYVRKSSSQKREYIPYGREVHRRSEERHRSRHNKDSDSCSRTSSPAPRSSTKSEKNSDKAESSVRPASNVENKTNVFRSDSNITEEREDSKIEIQKKNKSDGVKKLDVNDYREKKSGNSNGNNSAGKECEKNLLKRQSVLANLYGKLPAMKKQKNPEVASECGKKVAPCINSSSDESWTPSFAKKPQFIFKPRTLYSRRMEIKLKQRFKEDQKNSEGNCGNPNEGIHLEEKRVCAEKEKEGEVTFETDKKHQVRDDIVRKNEANENTKEALGIDKNNQLPDKLYADETCPGGDVEPEKLERAVAEKDSEMSFGENIIQKLLKLQKKEKTSGIKEFSPLKNNYKLSKISPLKSVEKQHILEYYNLKPAQQLKNIEPEILDFSFSVPETPGKNFTNPFSAADNQESVTGNEGDKRKTFEEDGGTFEYDKEDESNKGSDLYPVEVDETAEGSTFENYKKEASPEVKMLGRTRTQKKLKPDKTKEKQTDIPEVTSNNEANMESVAYQIRTRSRAGNENKKCGTEEYDVCEKKGKILKKSKSGLAKRKRGGVSSEEEEAEEEQQQQNTRKRVNRGTEMEISKSCNEEPNEKEVENGKGSDGSKTEDSKNAKDIAYFEVVPSVSRAANNEMTEQKNPEEPSLSNRSDSRPTNTSSSGTPKKLKPAGNSGDSSTFKVLRSYLMLSANKESDIEAFEDSTSSSSDSDSDSGASAFVDLL